MAFIKQLVQKILIVIARPARLLECLVRLCLLEVGFSFVGVGRLLT